MARGRADIAATAHDAGRAARGVATDSWARRAARWGFAVKGVLYLVIGGLAGKAALGAGGGTTTDNVGAIAALYRQPAGRAIVGLVAAGLLAYGLWSLVMAAFDTEGKGERAQGVVARIAFAAVGCSYLFLAWVTIRLITGQQAHTKSSDAATRDWTAQLLAHRGGVALVVVAGLAVLGVAGFFAYQALTARFRAQLDLSAAGGRARAWVVPLGRAGYAALAVVNGIIGLFLIIAALHRNPGEAKGVGGALDALIRRPYGAELLGVVAVGLIAYGGYALVEARYRILLRR